MKGVIKSIAGLFLVGIVSSCATGNVVVTDSPELPSVPQPTQTTQQPSTTPNPTPKEETMETRSSIGTQGTVKKTVSPARLGSLKYE